jgi:hypothetical protein
MLLPIEAFPELQGIYATFRLLVRVDVKVMAALPGVGYFWPQLLDIEHTVFDVPVPGFLRYCETVG